MRSLSPAPLRRRPLWACLLSLAVALLTLPTAPAFGQTPTLTVPEDFSIAASSADGIRLTQNGRNSLSFTFDDPDNTSFRLTVTNLGDGVLGCAAQIGDNARSLGPPNGALIPVGSHPITCNILRTSARDTFTLTVTAFVAPPAPPETNNPPVYTDPTTFTVEEDTTAVATLTATDAEGDSISFTLFQGLDSEFFSLDSTSGVLQFITAPDFDNPADSNMNNRYQVIVIITSGQDGEIATPVLQIQVTQSQPGTPSVAGSQPAGREYQITLTWNPPTGSTPSAYRLLRCQGTTCQNTAASAFIPIASTAGGSGQQTYVHSDRIDASTTYRYAVQSLDSSFRPIGRISASSTDFTTPALAPSAPRGLQSMVTNRRVALTWDAPDNNRPITGYTLTRTEAGSDTTIMIPGDRSLREYVDAGVMPNTAYSYTLTASNATGTSLPSNTVNSTTQAIGTTLAIPDQMLRLGGAAITLDVALYFEHVDNTATVNYTLTPLDATAAAIVTTSLTGSTLTLTPLAGGEVMVTITATDDSTPPQSVSQPFMVRVTALSAGDLHRAILPQVARAMTDSVAAAISGRIRQAADSATGATAAGPAFRLGGAKTLHDALAATAQPGGNATRYDALAATAGPAFRRSGNATRYHALATTAGPTLRLGGTATRYDALAITAGPAFSRGGTETLHDALAATAGPAFSLGGAEMRHDALTAHAPGAASGALDLSRLLNGSSFVLPLTAADNGAANPAALTFWGRGGYRNLEGGDGLNWDGRLASASIGLDGRPRPDMLLGVALAYSDGAFDYNNADGEGEYDITMTSAHPYLGLSWGRFDLWATAGYGEGEIEIAPQGETASRVDADLRSVTLGASGQLLSAEGWLNMPGAIAVRLKSEASATRIDVNGDAATEAAALSVDATRFRLALEGANERVLANGATVSPSLELGVRYDGGDGDSGAGLELGGGARYANPATGLSVEGKARVLLGRDDYDEWGVQGSLAMRPGADGQGLSFSLSPGYGGGGLQQLGRQGLPADGDDNAAADYRARLEARLGYGFAFALNGHDGMLTPYSELTLGATNRYRVGMNWKAGSLFDLTLLGERREDSGDDAEHALLLQGTVRF